MLINTLVDFCDKKYSVLENKCGNGKCSHPSGTCSGSCYNCLHEIHQPGNGAIQKKLYDCPKMLYHYVCQFSYLYASELLNAFIYKSDYLKDYSSFKILSIGCGPCVDLMALETFCHREKLKKPIVYFGIDSNSNWKIIHSKIEKYCDTYKIKRKFLCNDAFKILNSKTIPGANIIVISYVISYLYNNGQIKEIDSILDNIISNAIMKKKKDEKLLVIINDLNTYKRGRNYIDLLKTKLDEKLHNSISYEYKYFDTGNLFSGQKIGTPYENNNCLYEIPPYYINKYHARSTGQQTIQLILEVE